MPPTNADGDNPPVPAIQIWAPLPYAGDELVPPSHLATLTKAPPSPKPDLRPPPPTPLRQPAPSPTGSGHLATQAPLPPVMIRPFPPEACDPRRRTTHPRARGS
ncbi:hypothetical protein TIFTF001_017464 [Ficus carica]|uniref:Uncharacterized protein n=1 Tax=Ficus carica TaxID=3494 RepID=A0AA88A987_FICCA|nr:hypothetical protein TIFTF001_017464 [Ficus carica]